MASVPIPNWKFVASSKPWNIRTQARPATRPSPAAFSAFERDLHCSPPPTLGQHNREVLQSELGITEAELKRLETTGIIGNRPSFID